MQSERVRLLRPLGRADRGQLGRRSRFSSIDDHFDASDWSDASPAARVDFAERQEMYAVKLAKAAMLVYLRHDTQGSLWELRVRASAP